VLEAVVPPHLSIAPSLSLGTATPTSSQIIPTNAEIIQLSLLPIIMIIPSDQSQRLKPAVASDGGAANQQPDLSKSSLHTFDRHTASEDAVNHGALTCGLEDLRVDDIKMVAAQGENEMDQGNDLHDGERGPPPSTEDRLFERERSLTMQYLLENVAEFRELADIRKKASATSSPQPTLPAADSLDTGLGQS
jgi:hypothetical protein